MRPPTAIDCEREQRDSALDLGYTPRLDHPSKPRPNCPRKQPEQQKRRAARLKSSIRAGLTDLVPSATFRGYLCC
jgi:hypothetical protein